MQSFTNPEAGSAYGASIRREALYKLPELLETFEKNATAKGANVIWARDAAEANDAIVKIARENHIQYVAKGKSMITEELGLNEALINNNIQPYR